MAPEIDMEEVRKAVDTVSNTLFLALSALAAIENRQNAWPGVNDVLNEEELAILHHAVDQLRKGNLDL